MSRLGARSALLAFALLAACEDDALLTSSGTLEIEVRNARMAAATLLYEVTPEGGEVLRRDMPAARPAAFTTFEQVATGPATVKVVALELDAAPLDSVTVRGIVVLSDRVSRVVIDFALVGTPEPEPRPTPEEICNGRDDDGDMLIDEGVRVLCGVCQADASVLPAEDDALCGEIACDALNRYALAGDNTASGRSECTLDRFGPLTDRRCAAIGQCRAAHDASVCGPPTPSLELEAGLCQIIEGCSERTPGRLVTVADGTPCGPMEVCRGGQCVPEQPVTPPDPVGCADGEREGFTDRMAAPDIAGCSGGWSVPGVRATLSPICNRVSGDDSTNPSGQGCSVADLCAIGWHVCADKEEVAARSPSGCASAVPPGTPNNGLLFITRQRSTNNIVCEDRASATGVNDLIGCGNLGPSLDASKNCAPLDRALASQHDGRCDFNEAEPPLGPWMCGASSIRESENVTKSGPALGGVLCCRN